MGYDNRILDVNGNSYEQLQLALKFAFTDQYGKNTCKGWEFNPKKGLVLYQYFDASNKNISKFPAPMSDEDIFPIVKSWLATEEAKSVPLADWEKDIDHDGDNIEGWRLYVEDWGHVDGQWGALCAVKRVMLWLGK